LAGLIAAEADPAEGLELDHRWKLQVWVLLTVPHVERRRNSRRACACYRAVTPSDAARRRERLRFGVTPVQGGRSVIRQQLYLLLFLVGACHPTKDREPIGQGVAAELPSVEPGCEDDSVRPATAAPAEGLWVYQDPVTFHRIAARVGPARTSAGNAQLTRRVETLEERSGSDAIRQASDTASVQLELIPPTGRPAAVYPVGLFVMLASYEPCSPALREPLIRYLRRDTQGRVATDVLLRRDAAP
jgi:hypothetical protein